MYHTRQHMIKLSKIKDAKVISSALPTFVKACSLDAI